jgi:hypothetical protein
VTGEVFDTGMEMQNDVLQTESWLELYSYAFNGKTPSAL